MSHYVVLLYAPSETAGESSAEGRAAHSDHFDFLVKSGALRASIALEDPAIATSVRPDLITDGPFIEAKEVILGLCLLEAPDLDAALALAQLNPIIQQGGGVEVRPVEGFYLDPKAASD